MNDVIARARTVMASETPCDNEGVACPLSDVLAESVPYIEALESRVRKLEGLLREAHVVVADAVDADGREHGELASRIALALGETRKP
jgi:hypothetical protein